ncbi:MAG: ZIP family metal transporter [Candidatus Pacebacteria bacterium]|nr:ZIP family metal transporter [Candidatus Paceibacterota bacterium]
MDTAILYTIISIIIMILSSFVGVFIFLIREETLQKVIMFLLSFSIGVMLGTAFLTLIPESLNYGQNISIYIIIGFLFSLILEKFLKCKYCHKNFDFDKNIRSFAYVNLFTDAIQNFISGLIISTSYMVSIPFGISTSTALILNELPQEVSDFAILIHGGFEKNRAFVINFLTTLVTGIGAVVGFLIGSLSSHFVYFLVSFAAGNFIYIASADLIPELNKELNFRKSLLQVLFIILGILLIALLSLL